MQISHFPVQEILEYQGNMRIRPFEKTIRNNFLSYVIIITITVICIYQNYTVLTIERYNSEEIAMWVLNSLLYTVVKYPVFTTNFFYN